MDETKNVSLPIKLLLDLSRLNISSYEWRVMVNLLVHQYTSRDQWADPTADELHEATGIPKPHISRAIKHLVERNLINKYSYKQTAIFQVNWIPDVWRSMLGANPERSISQTTNEAFNLWIERYPNPMHAEDARRLYASLIQSGETTIEELDDALTGYMNHERVRAEKFGRDPDAWYIMYPTSFLQNDKWKEYLAYKDLKRRPPQ